MTEKDKHELDVLRLHIQQLQIDAHRRDHELITLQIHTTEQRHQLDRLTRLLAMLGLHPDDLNAPGALTSKATLLLRLSRPEN